MGRCSSCKKPTTEKGITFHRFPGNEIERQKWVKNMGKPDLIPAKTAILCSNHFTSDCFEHWWNITRLRKGSVPTIFTQNAMGVHINSDKGQASNKRLKVNVSNPTTSVSPSVPISGPSCAQESSSVEEILPTQSPEISIPSCVVSTPKSSTCRKQLTVNTSRRRELLKHDHHYEDTPRTSQKKLNLIRQKYELSQKKIKSLKRQVSNLKTTVYSLRKAAYDFVRKTFESALPHPDVIRTWYASVDAEPGCVKDCFSTLKYKVSRAGEKGEQITCALLMDEIGIKKGSQRGRDGKQTGHIDVGTGMNVGDDLPEAKDSFVFVVLSLDADWKLPIGYFLVNGLSAKATKTNMVRESLIRLEQVGVKVCSLTMDDPPEHFSMLKKLGANLDKDSEKFQPYFPHSIATEPPINVFLDPCHMLKNIRNCLAEYKILIDENGAEIKWYYIMALAQLQEKEGLWLGNKLRTCHHIDYKKMTKVSLAAQTLSTSISHHVHKLIKMIVATYIELRFYALTKKSCTFSD